MEWNSDMSQAPKDGTRILVYYAADDGVYDVIWDNDLGWVSQDYEIINFLQSDITHWMRLPEAPMEAELWAAGCDLETARFVAQQLERDGYVLVKPSQLWAAHKHFEGERKFALRRVMKWLKKSPGDEAEAVGQPHGSDNLGR